MPIAPNAGYDDSLIVGFLTGVRMWSLAFFESRGARERDLVRQQAWSEKAKETSFTLKLVSDLLARGYGGLADGPKGVPTG